MTDILASHIEQFAAHAHLWGFLIVFVFMTIESSFIPFPSEIVMIPAGFLAFDGKLFFANPVLDLTIVILCGIAGSILGAYVNYYISLKLGRVILYKYGKFILLKPEVIERAEEIFLKYGDITTFVCRLLPAIRQLISIPAGLSKMPLGKFTFYTTLGAGIWTAFLAAIGYYFAHFYKKSQDVDQINYKKLVVDGKNLIHDQFIWILLILFAIILTYIFVHKKIMKKSNEVIK